MPLWLLLFVGGFFGLLVGWFGSWLAQGKWRKAARNSRSEVAQLQRELADLRGNNQRLSDQTNDATIFPGDSYGMA